MNFYHEAIEAKQAIVEALSERHRKMEKLATTRKTPPGADMKKAERLLGIGPDDDLWEIITRSLPREAEAIRALSISEPYYWEPRLTELALFAGGQLGTSVKFHQSWLNSQYAFWWLGPKASTYFPALNYWWVPSASQVRVFGFSFTGPDATEIEGTEITWTEGSSIFDVMRSIDQRMPMDSLNEEQAEWENQNNKRKKKLVQVFAAGNLWLQQKLIVTEKAKLDRAARRRLERLNISTDCLVVHLRRKEYAPTGNHRTVDWAWQWVQRGHWRHLPPDREIWISPGIKGPEGKPFKSTSRIFSVDH